MIILFFREFNFEGIISFPQFCILSFKVLVVVFGSPFSNLPVRIYWFSIFAPEVIDGLAQGSKKLFTVLQHMITEHC